MASHRFSVYSTFAKTIQMRLRYILFYQFIFFIEFIFLFLILHLNFLGQRSILHECMEYFAHSTRIKTVFISSFYAQLLYFLSRKIGSLNWDRCQRMFMDRTRSIQIYNRIVL